jgi:hypothetical protein
LAAELAKLECDIFFGSGTEANLTALAQHDELAQRSIGPKMGGMMEP